MPDSPRDGVAAMGQPEPGTVQIAFAFQIKVGPGVDIAETAVWGDKIVLTDLDPNIDLKKLGEDSVRMLVKHFANLFLKSVGALEVGPSGYPVRDAIVSIELSHAQDP